MIQVSETYNTLCRSSFFLPARDLLEELPGVRRVYMCDDYIFVDVAPGTDVAALDEVLTSMVESYQ